MCRCYQKCAGSKCQYAGLCLLTSSPLISRAYIDTDLNSKDFGNVISPVDIFTDTDGFVPQKVNRIKSLAATMATTEDYGRCDELLEEFHTACNPQDTSCPKENDQSFQLR